MTLLDDFLGKKTPPELNEPPIEEEDIYISPKRLREMTTPKANNPTPMSPPVCVLCGRKVKITEDGKGYCNKCNRVWTKFGVVTINGRRIDVMY
jgi:hypothetical protein